MLILPGAGRVPDSGLNLTCERRSIEDPNNPTGSIMSHSSARNLKRDMRTPIAMADMIQTSGAIPLDAIAGMDSQLCACGKLTPNSQLNGVPLAFCMQSVTSSTGCHS